MQLKEEKQQREQGGFLQRLRKGLSKTRINWVSGIDRLFLGAGEIDDDFYEELEEQMIMGDMGIKTTSEILIRLKERVKIERIKEKQICRDLLLQILEEFFIKDDLLKNESINNESLNNESLKDALPDKMIVTVIGVNGVGKTTTIGKLASLYKAQGKKVVIAAADTFRAAASEQLQVWASRAEARFVGSKEGADPSAVLYDAVAVMKAKGADILLCDTAGRLHNKKNLMEELSKMNRVISREYPDIHRENYLVVDATTGQNALHQAREFHSVIPLTGIILTKMDGTAKGGIAIAIYAELGIPVKYIGVGESVEDLQAFDYKEYLQALFSSEHA